MTRDEWISAFLAELQRLRPHLVPQYGSSKLLTAIAAQEHAAHGEDEPVAAARAYDQRTKP